MDINEIKQVPIVDFLYILGIEPVKHKASGLWYHAPYRNDRNPSLRVSTDKNVWYDYGIARGGDIFNLAGEFINSNEFVAQAKFISETLGGSFPTSFPHHQRIAEKAVKAKGNPFSDIVEKPLSHPALRQYLRERGILPYIILCGKTLYPESEIQALLTGNYRKPIIDGTVSQGEGTAS